ncbi:MAG: small subunit ribosomal protein [Patescibacteria group bacterium]|nr:small subunit ribosomal protein [Patescibacteria group bacterium]
MARNLTPISKLSRREGVQLHPKAAKALAKRNFAPGQHGQARRPKPSDYAVQLREKQKVKRLYGVMEKQFRRYVGEAERREGVAGENLLRLLEQRLDNAVYRLGLAPSRQAARQMVTHAHIRLNDKKVDVPSIQVKVGDIITIKESSKKKPLFADLAEQLKNDAREMPSWLKLDAKKMVGTVTSQPLREDSDNFIEEQLIIEFYSR